MGFLDYAILIVLATLAMGIVLGRRKKRGRGGCNGDCGSCTGCQHHHE